MNVKDTKVETGFYITINQQEKVYIIEDDIGSMLALVWRTYRLKPFGKQYQLIIEYELQYNSCKKLSIGERQMIRIYYDNLVRTLTRDMQTIYSDHIEERMQLPFYQNILHIKVI